MKLRYFASVVVLGLTTVAASAQVGLYLNPVATRVSNSVLDTSNYAFLGTQSTERTFWGLNFGGYYDFYHAGKLNVGMDLRQTVLHANNAAMKEFLVGMRVSGTPFTRPLKPYLQASIGSGATKAPTSQISVKKVDYRIYAGVDYTLQKHVDFRVIEVGYGSLKTISSATVGAGANIAIPASNLIQFSTGLVFRF